MAEYERGYDAGYDDGESSMNHDWVFALNEIGGLPDDFNYSPQYVGRYVARLREAIKRIRFAVNSDSYAITFQTIGQYRTAILKVIAAETNNEED